MKKFLSLVLSVLVVFSMTVFAFAGTEEKAPLSFDENGKFTIMSICDIQDNYPINKAALALICEALDTVKPDIVVLGGDNIMLEVHKEGTHGEGVTCEGAYCENIKLFDEAVAPFVERNIPFTLVFGNHDSENGKPSREWQLSQFQRAGGSLCLAYDAVEELHGCGTHNLPVLSSDKTKTAFNLWMFDSGDYDKDDNGIKCYDCVHEDQINWYKQTSAQLQSENGGKVPSLAFQHIIVKEVYDAVFHTAPKALATRKFSDETGFYLIPDLSKINGIILEMSCPSYYNYGQWDAFVERGDVLGCVTGHDHINSFVATYKGVDIIQTPTVTSKSYYNNLNKGVRVLTINENDPWHYETEIVTCASLAIKEGSTIPENSKIPVFVYKIYNFLYNLIYNIFN